MIVDRSNTRIFSQIVESLVSHRFQIVIRVIFRIALYPEKILGQNPIFGPQGPGGGQKGGQNQNYVKNWSEKAKKWQTDLFLHQKLDFTNVFSQFTFFDPFLGSPGAAGGQKG